MKESLAALRTSAIQPGDPRVIRGWVMYDWANSVFQLTITTAIFPFYYEAVTEKHPAFPVNFLGVPISSSVLYSWTIAIAFLVVGALSPLLSSMADYTGRRKTFMKVFTWIGAVACAGLFFFDSAHLALGVISFGLATLGYAGSIVFYNSFLPVIALPEDQDRISARGYSMGYIGGVVLLLFNLWMILMPGFFGFSEDSDLPPKISFLTVAFWWIGFSQYTFLRLPKYTFRQREGHASVMLNGYKELQTVFRVVRKSFTLSVFLIGFLFMMAGVLTVMYMAPIFGFKELNLNKDDLIATLVLIQFVGVLGAWSFSRLSGRIGNFKAMIVAVIIWIAVIFGAYTIHTLRGFIIAGVFIGLVMGGCQSLARSTYSKLLPATKDHTSYFSFYDVMEKIATVVGLFAFGLFDQITGSMRAGIMAIAIFFVISLGCFLLISRKVLKSAEL